MEWQTKPEGIEDQKTYHVAIQWDDESISTELGHFYVFDDGVVEFVLTTGCTRSTGRDEHNIKSILGWFPWPVWPRASDKPGQQLDFKTPMLRLGCNHCFGKRKNCEFCRAARTSMRRLYRQREQRITGQLELIGATQ